jgi:hypothetical protein
MTNYQRSMVAACWPSDGGCCRLETRVEARGGEDDDEDADVHSERVGGGGQC